MPLARSWSTLSPHKLPCSNSCRRSLLEVQRVSEHGSGEQLDRQKTVVKWNGNGFHHDDWWSRRNGCDVVWCGVVLWALPLLRSTYLVVPSGAAVESLWTTLGSCCCCGFLWTTIRFPGASNTLESIRRLVVVVVVVPVHANPTRLWVGETEE